MFYSIFIDIINILASEGISKKCLASDLIRTDFKKVFDHKDTDCFFFRPPHDQPPIDILIYLYLVFLFALFIMVLKRGDG